VTVGPARAGPRRAKRVPNGSRLGVFVVPRGAYELAGPDHPDTLTSRNNLAYAYQEAGRLGDTATPA